ncbi:adenylate kinase isoenzyme 1-like [Drosophila madeirensis]|uniref:Adenylate kinase isoenzyme 1-like n=1 Tax=Drosophila madeirensis TaxID=30013 RepID=A0AAU9FLU7_DROMD|nr:adenylate kinase isoenzyme 1-like [Drosophila subobscura]
MNAPIVWIMGGPNSGKDVQVQKIVEKYGFTHIDPNAMVDKEIEAKSADGKKFEAIRKDGKEVPLADIVPLVEKQIMSQRGGINGFLIDGYPRNEAEAKVLEDSLGKPTMIIALDVQGDTNKKEPKAVLQKYSNITMQLNAERDANEVFEDLVPNMETLVKNRGPQISIGR